MKTSVYIATSIDGFIAREDGDIDWLTADADFGGGEDYGYEAFMSSVDALVMGRGSFEKVLTFGTWLYGKKPVVVLSSRGVEIPDEIAGTVSSLSAPPAEVIRILAERGYQHLYIDGGKTIQRFLNADLIDQLIITRIPVLIGSGIPLFGPVPEDIHLRHMETRAFANGLVQSRYERR